MAGGIVFGHVEGFPVGSAFRTRKDLAEAGVHRPLQVGIAGSWKSGGADSVVVSGGYEDDQDEGDLIIYTGHGGSDPSTKKQVKDQTLDASGNRALAYNKYSGYPVRVIRGSGGDPDHSPASGFRYDGLFRVEDYGLRKGRSGHMVARFRLTGLAEADVHAFEEELPSSDAPVGKAKPKRRETSTTRVVRDSVVGRWVKQKHKFHCQFCGETLQTPVGPYAEGAHIRPLGKPHLGPDVAENILCLCPNHHVLFDSGAVGVAAGGRLIGLIGVLRLARGHEPAPEQFAYHREIHGLQERG